MLCLPGTAEPDRVTVQAGLGKLVLTRGAPFDRVRHLAFGISPDDFELAQNWVRGQVDTRRFRRPTLMGFAVVVRRKLISGGAACTPPADSCRPSWPWPELAGRVRNRAAAGRSRRCACPHSHPGVAAVSPESTRATRGVVRPRKGVGRVASSPARRLARVRGRPARPACRVRRSPRPWRPAMTSGTSQRGRPWCPRYGRSPFDGSRSPSVPR
ncbi:hypothetical protein [Nocardia suismassiliense]|uniref:hypothetical protein n=1 Tax=Nocardia suismassiliense TaxID=2077092 RepID=UPI003899174C